MKKRILSILLVCFLAAVGLCVNANAADIVDTGDYSTQHKITWTLYDDGMVVFSGTGNMDYTFMIGYEHKDEIKTAVIEDGITSIAPWLFSGCYNLTTVTIPPSVTTINQSAFYECINLTTVNLSNGLTRINDAAFYECEKLRSIHLPESLEYISGNAFHYCSSLETIVIPDNVYHIDGAFSYCTGLREVTLGSSLQTIPSLAFSRCSKLETVTIREGVGNISESAFCGCVNLQNIIIPGSVKTVGKAAFDHCESLEEVIISDGVEKIDREAFSYCKKLKSIKLPTSIIEIGARAFANSENLKDIFYSGTKNQWNAIKIDNSDAYYRSHFTAIIHCTDGDIHSTTVSIPDVFITPEPDKGIYPIDICMQHSSTIYDNDLAEIAGELSLKTYDNGGQNDESVKGYLNYDQGFLNGGGRIQPYNYGSSLAYTVATKKYNGSDAKDNTYILVVVARGSQTTYEFIQDAFSKPTGDWNGHPVYGIASEFAAAMLNGMYQVMEPGKYYKVLITGHSLGGAAANLLAAMISDQTSTNREDIFCYTFGAINSAVSAYPIHSGYENIHNIYNLCDTFSPTRLGKTLPNGAGTMNGKFGHLHLFLGRYIGSLNHDMSNYLDAVKTGAISTSKLRSCLNTNGGVWRFSVNKCPVDVDVYCEGALVGRVVNNVVDESVTTLDIVVEGDAKIILYPDDREYELRITATDEGEMVYYTEDLRVPEEAVLISDVELTPGKTLTSTLSVDVPAARLYVTDTTGKPVSEVQPDGSETPVTNVPETDIPSTWARTEINAAIAAELVPIELQKNYTQPVLRGQVAQLFINLLEKSTGKTIDEILTEKGATINPEAFIDTNAPAVLATNALGIINGVGDNKFDPTGTLTRAQIAAIINRVARVLDVETSGYAHTFTDVAGHWVDTELGWPVHAGIINGVGDNRFDPDSSLTTEQAIAITYRALCYFLQIE